MRSVMIMGAVTTVFCIVVDFFALGERIGGNTGVYSLLGIALSIVLVYRTNTAYDRWWEGRQQWGALVNTCRDLAIPVDRIDKRYYRYMGRAYVFDNSGSDIELIL